MKSSISSRSVLAIVALGCALGISAPVSAADFHGQMDNPMQDIPAVADFQTTGADMAGMAVTAFFSAAPPETAIWQVTGATSGVALGAGGDWGMSVNGDTFNSPWTLLYTGGKGLLTGFSIDGFAAGAGAIGVMFDRTFGGVLGTPNSFLGRDYATQTPAPAFDTYVVYRGAVGVGGAAPVGDEFRWLDVRFLNLGGIVDEFTSVPPQVAGLDGINTRTLSFVQDTNNPIVPEPASLALLLGGACVLGLSRRHRRA